MRIVALTVLAVIQYTFAAALAWAGWSFIQQGDTVGGGGIMLAGALVAIPPKYDPAVRLKERLMRHPNAS